MRSFFKELLVAAIAASLLLPATAIAGPAEKRQLKITVHPKYSKHRWRGYGFLPGYRQPPYIAEWRDRSARSHCLAFQCTDESSSVFDQAP